MIADERQYRITKGWVERFEESLARADEQGANLHPRLKQAMRESVESEIEVLREQLAEYEASRLAKAAAAPARRRARGGTAAPVVESHLIGPLLDYLAPQTPVAKEASQGQQLSVEGKRVTDLDLNLGTSTPGDFEYEVALSFAGEDRAYVEELARLLTDAGVSVFYDRYEEADLWGRDLYVHLDDVYRKKARYCVLFASRHYAEKAWPNHERRSAQARALKQKGEYILPVRFDDTEIPGLPPTIGYVTSTANPPASLTALILEKLGPVVPREGKRQWGYCHPAPYSGRVWIRVQAMAQNRGVAHRYLLRWGPLQYEGTLSFAGGEDRYLWHMKGDDGLSIPLFFDIDPPAKATFGRGELPYPEAIDINFGWRRVEPAQEEDYETNRPMFGTRGGVTGRAEEDFNVQMWLAKLSGDAVRSVSWRFCGPRFRSDWRSANAFALDRTPLVGTWDLREGPKRDPEEDGRVGLDEFGVEISFSWRGRTWHELHKWSLKRRIVNGKRQVQFGDPEPEVQTWSD